MYWGSQNDNVRASVQIIVIIHHRQITSRSWSFLWDSIYSPLLLEVVWAYCTLPILSSNLGMNRFVPSDIAQTATTFVFVQLVCARPVAAIFGWLGKAFPWWAFWLAPQLAAWNWILGPTCHQDACHTFILHYIIAFMLLIFCVIVLFWWTSNFRKLPQVLRLVRLDSLDHLLEFLSSASSLLVLSSVSATHWREKKSKMKPAQPTETHPRILGIRP